MNLNLTHALLCATVEQPHGFLKVRGPHLIREVKLMARAGLVESTIGNDDGETFAVINRVTDSGRTFLRTFKYQTPSNTDLRPQEGLIRQLSTAS